MFAEIPILSLTIWLPILGGLWLVFAGEKYKRNKIRRDALAFSSITFLLSLGIWANFDHSSAALQFVERLPWVSTFNIEYFIGVDGIALLLIILTTFISILVILSGWIVIQDRLGLYMGSFLLLEGLMIGVCSAADASLFYVFWEALQVM